MYFISSKESCGQLLNKDTNAQQEIEEETDLSGRVEHEAIIQDETNSTVDRIIIEARDEFRAQIREEGRNIVFRNVLLFIASIPSYIKLTTLMILVSILLIDLDQMDDESMNHNEYDSDSYLVLKSRSYHPV